jgi:hypothetical protein
MSVTLTFDLPEATERHLRAECDLEAALREAFVVCLYRRGVITRPELGHVLGLCHDEVGELLVRHGMLKVRPPMATPADAGQVARVPPEPGGYVPDQVLDEFFEALCRKCGGAIRGLAR